MKFWAIKAMKKGHWVLLGMGSVINIGGASIVSRQTPCSLADELRVDFEAVGQDLIGAMGWYGNIQQNHQQEVKQLEFPLIKA